MENIKNILRINFSDFDVIDITDKFHGENVIKLLQNLEYNHNKIFIIKKNEENALILQIMSKTNNNYLILNKDNYLSIDEHIINNEKTLKQKLISFLMHENNICCICKEPHLHCTLCKICNAITCHMCMTKLYASSGKKNVICPLCRNDNLQ